MLRPPCPCGALLPISSQLPLLFRLVGEEAWGAGCCGQHTVYVCLSAVHANFPFIRPRSQGVCGAPPSSRGEDTHGPGQQGACGTCCIKYPSPYCGPPPTFLVLSYGLLNPILKLDCSLCNAWGHDKLHCLGGEFKNKRRPRKLFTRWLFVRVTLWAMCRGNLRRLPLGLSKPGCLGAHPRVLT